MCDVLTSTGVAGRPESFFREQDELRLAQRFGVPVADNGSFDYGEYVAGAVRAGTSANGVFGARVMWGTVERLVKGLSRGPGVPDLDVLVDAFGPLVLVHVRREDVIGQAVSWARAEQTGHWQHGDATTGRPRLDLEQVDTLVRTIHVHNECWAAWFSAQGARPHVVTYEKLVADPARTVKEILDHLNVQPTSGWRPSSLHPRQADEVNAEWVRRYRAALDVRSRGPSMVWGPGPG